MHTAEKIISPPPVRNKESNRAESLQLNTNSWPATVFGVPAPAGASQRIDYSSATCILLTESSSPNILVHVSNCVDSPNFRIAL